MLSYIVKLTLAHLRYAQPAGHPYGASLLLALAKRMASLRDRPQIAGWRTTGPDHVFSAVLQLHLFFLLCNIVYEYIV